VPVGFVPLAFTVSQLAADVRRDSTSHNLWPFEVVSATAIGRIIMGAVFGVTPDATTMNAILAATVRAVVAVIGVLVALLLLNVSLFSIQGMSGQQPFAPTFVFFTLSFALAFGVGAVSVRALTGRRRLWPTACAFGIGGASGGALFALALRAVDQFEPQLRVLTGGGPLGGFLLAAALAAVGVTLLVGMAVVRRLQKGIDVKHGVR
jgi:hypothetical protein